MATSLFWLMIPRSRYCKPKDEAKVDQGQDGSQAAIHQRAIDQHIDVVQSIAQNREPNGERNQEQGDGPDDSK